MSFKHRDATNYGIDIARGRVDDLDRQIIDFVIRCKGRRVAIDIGSGRSRLSVILGLLGFEVWCYDIENYAKYFATLNEVLGLEGRVHFKQLDISTLSYSDLPDDITVAVSQRTLHHLPYNDAKSLLSKVYTKMIDSGRLYISLSGLNSKLSDGYKCAESPVAERFCEVGEVGKTVYSISGKVCLYTTEEVHRLMEECNFVISEINESNFGNIKIVATK